MTDQPSFRALFRQGDMSTRLRRLALNLEIIGDQFGDGLTVIGLEARIEESHWMIDCIAGFEDPDVYEELAELRRGLDEWRSELVTIVASTQAREEARERAGAWADRLMWVSALLEATK